MMLKKIVIAEDDDAIAHMVSMALGDAGYLCLRARDGDEALKLVKAASGQPCDVKLDRFGQAVNDVVHLRDLVGQSTFAGHNRCHHLTQHRLDYVAHSERFPSRVGKRARAYRALFHPDTAAATDWPAVCAPAWRSFMAVLRLQMFGPDSKS